MPKGKGYSGGFKKQSPSTMGKSATKTRPKGMRKIVTSSNGTVGKPSKTGGKRVY